MGGLDYTVSGARVVVLNAAPRETLQQNVVMTPALDLDAPENRLKWPVAIFVAELRALSGDELPVRVLLRDAFATDALSERGDVGVGLEEELLRRADELVEVGSRRYYLQRRAGQVPPTEPDWAAASDAWTLYVTGLETAQWLDRVLGKDCPDRRRPASAGQVVSQEVGFSAPWPPDFQFHAPEFHDLFGDPPVHEFLSVVEWVGDHVARPRHWSREHDFSGCGMHFSTFGVQTGRALYRLRVNEIFTQYGIPFEIATGGEDDGFVVDRIDPVRAELIATVTQSATEVDATTLEHAVAQFRSRGATRDDKRAAVLALARLVESERVLLKRTLFRKDEGALFDIANNFDLRHKTASQQDDYPVEYLDWIFWWYLATIELFQRLSKNQAAPSQA